MNCNLYLVNDGPFTWCVRAHTIYHAAALALPKMVHTTTMSTLDGPKTQHAWKRLLEMVREDLLQLEQPNTVILTYDEILEEYEDSKALERILRLYKEDPDEPEVFLGFYGEDNDTVHVP